MIFYSIFINVYESKQYLLCNVFRIMIYLSQKLKSVLNTSVTLLIIFFCNQQICFNVHTSLVSKNLNVIGGFLKIFSGLQLAFFVCLYSTKFQFWASQERYILCIKMLGFIPLSKSSVVGARHSKNYKNGNQTAAFFYSYNLTFSR